MAGVVVSTVAEEDLQPGIVLEAWDGDLGVDTSRLSPLVIHSAHHPQMHHCTGHLRQADGLNAA